MVAKISILNRVIISLGVIGVFTAYVVTAGLTYTYVIYLASALVALNLFLIMPRSLAAALITLAQAITLSSFVFLYTAVTMPTNETLALAYMAVNLALIISVHYLTYRFASGRLWFNLLVAYTITDVSVIVTMKDQVAFQPAYIAGSYIIYILFIAIKNFNSNRNKVTPRVSSNDLNNVLSKKVTKLLKEQTFKKGSSVISRYVLAGNKILFLHEPANIKPSRLSKQGLFYGEEDYSAILDKLIQESLRVSKEYKISKNIIMPIVVVHDYKKNSISQLEVKDNRKPDYTVGAVYVCSPSSLNALISSLKAKATPKGKVNAEIKYKIVK